MKITVEGLASIRKATVDLRPLTVIIGPNNSAKTYLAYAIYGALQAFDRGVLPEVSQLLDYDGGYTGPDSYEDSTEARLETNEQLIRRFVDAKAHVAGEFASTFADFLRHEEGSHPLLNELSISLTDEEVAALVEVVSERFHGGFTFELDWPDHELNWSDVREKMAEVDAVIDSANTYAPFILPAERLSLILTYKILAHRRIRALKEVWPRFGRNAPSLAAQMKSAQQVGEYFLPQPVEDFLDFLASWDAGEGIKGDPHNAHREPLPKLAALLERQINRGVLLKEQSNEVGGKNLRIQVPKGPGLALHNASSSIKQLTPLILYLRHRAQPGDLLIIDEPEMNLHPENQVKLLEIFGILVSLGVKVLMTTHSPYFLQHLNNLILGHPDPKVAKRQAKDLYLKDVRAFIKPEDVSAYEMKNQEDGSTEVVDLKEPEFGTIRYDTLGDIFSDLRGRFFNLDKLRHPAASTRGKS